MKAIKKILVPVDFSSCSKRALENAASLAEKFGASIDVLHVWEATYYAERHAEASLPGKDGAEKQAAASRVSQELETMLEQIVARGGVKIGRMHENGEPARVIVDTASRGAYDLIVMGTHGRAGQAHDYLGSVAEKVIRRAPCPVLTIRERVAMPTTEAPKTRAGAL